MVHIISHYAVTNPRCSIFIDADQIWPMGLAIFLPAISGADPWTGSNIEGKTRSGLILADGATAIVPVTPGPRSERISPNRLLATTTLKRSGDITKRAARISIWYWSTVISGYSAAIV